MTSQPPELSLFQGMPSLHIDNKKMRPEEEEEIRDRERRRNEVKKSLNYF
jgi:hypothetical protein